MTPFSKHPWCLSFAFGHILLSASEGANIIVNSLANSPDGTVLAKKVVGSDGVNLPLNSLVRVGYFNTTSGTTLNVLSNDFYGLNANFVAFGENIASADDGSTGPIRINANGQIGGSIQNIPAAYAPEGTAIYIWVLNVTSAVTATEWAIFRDPAWVVPAEIGSVNLATWQIHQSSEVLRGSLDLPSNQIKLAAIPEPSASWFIVMTALWGRCFRRDRQR